MTVLPAQGIIGRRRGDGVVLVVVLGLLAGCVTVAPRPRPPARAPRDLGTDTAAVATTIESLVEAHNRVRRRHRLAPLAVDARLMRSAQAHADDMAARRRMSHRGSDGSSPFRRMERAGFSFTRAAENVAAGQTSLDELTGDWLRGPGHRRNILGSFTAIGAGYAIDPAGTPYWCVTFGTPDDGVVASRGANVGYP